MTPETITAWVGAIISILGAVAVIIKAVKVQPGEKADAAETYQQIAAKAAADVKRANERLSILEEKVRNQQDEIDRLTRQLEAYQKGIKVLLSQLEANNIPPGWIPTEIK